MSTGKEIRKLAAVMHADVKGYSRLMGDDESYTVRTIKESREIFSKQVKKHEGRIVNAPGDSILAEFPSVVAAVKCAVEIQEQLSTRNTSLPDDRKMEFRIGINLGEIMQEGERIYGDGVNVAARIEALAEPGGVAIARNIYDQVKGEIQNENTPFVLVRWCDDLLNDIVLSSGRKGLYNLSA
jgi:class 3 adenylate cyclase